MDVSLMKYVLCNVQRSLTQGGGYRAGIFLRGLLNTPPSSPNSKPSTLNPCSAGQRQRRRGHDGFTLVKRFRRGLVFKAHRWLYHSTLASRVIKKKNILMKCVLCNVQRSSTPKEAVGRRLYTLLRAETRRTKPPSTCSSKPVPLYR